MYIGKVIGTVVSTIKISHLDGRKLLLVDQLDLEGNETGAYDIAVDVVQAGPGDTVLVIDEGNGARQILQLDPGLSGRYRRRRRWRRWEDSSWQLAGGGQLSAVSMEQASECTKKKECG
jgi:microcompartment protein CcmK/EutM